MLWKCWETSKEKYKYEQNPLIILVKEHIFSRFIAAFNLQLCRVKKGFILIFQLIVYTLGITLKTSGRKKVRISCILCYSRYITFLFQQLLQLVRVTNRWSTFNKSNNHLINNTCFWLIRTIIRTMWKYTLESIIHGTWKEYENCSAILLMTKQTDLRIVLLFHTYTFLLFWDFF